MCLGELLKVRGMIKPPLSVFNLPSPHPPSQALLRNGDVRTVTSTFQLLSTRARVAITSRCEFDIICVILGQPVAFVDIRGIASGPGLSAESRPGTDICLQRIAHTLCDTWFTRYHATDLPDDIVISACQVAARKRIRGRFTTNGPERALRPKDFWIPSFCCRPRTPRSDSIQ